MTASPKSSDEEDEFYLQHVLEVENMLKFEVDRKDSEQVQLHDLEYMKVLFHLVRLSNE